MYICSVRRFLPRRCFSISIGQFTHGICNSYISWVSNSKACQGTVMFCRIRHCKERRGVISVKMLREVTDLRKRLCNGFMLPHPVTLVTSIFQKVLSSWPAGALSFCSGSTFVEWTYRWWVYFAREAAPSKPASGPRTVGQSAHCLQWSGKTSSENWSRMVSM